jgi:tRNA A37 threonylcarbamoyladenosine modification protein TsaB
LRIGMATAKGIAFAAGRPLWAVSSLAALAHEAGAGAGERVQHVGLAVIIIIMILAARNDVIRYLL